MRSLSSAVSEFQKSIAILGAGKVGVVLGQLARKAGYDVYIAGSSDPAKIKLTIETLIPGAHAVTSEEAASSAGIIILALPLGKYKNIPKQALNGKLVIDAMNYWWEVDGDRPDLTDLRNSSSEIVAGYLPDSRVVKAFNHIGYHDLYDDTRPKGALDRKAIAIAGNDKQDTDHVSEIVDAFGFDPVAIGDLAQGVKLQPGSNVFGAHVAKDDLKRLVDSFPRTDLGRRTIEARSGTAHL